MYVHSGNFSLTLYFFLARVEELRVEDMMKRSFAELGTQKQQAGYKERATELQKELQNMADITGK